MSENFYLKIREVLLKDAKSFSLEVKFDKTLLVRKSCSRINWIERVIKVIIGFKGDSDFSLEHLPLVIEHELIHVDLFYEGLDDLVELTKSGITTQKEVSRAILRREKRVWRRFLDNLTYPVMFLDIAQISLNTFAFGPTGMDAHLWSWFE